MQTKIIAFYEGEHFSNETLTRSTLEHFNDQQNHLSSYSVPDNRNPTHINFIPDAKEKNITKNPTT